MNNGVCILAQNNSTTNYVEQAYALTLSILANDPNTKVSIITNDTIPKFYKNVFDQIISIPFDDAELSAWKIDNRWKLYQLSPYENTLVFDADMLVIDSIEHIWNDKENLSFTTNVTTYQNQLITSRYYRKAFDENNLPNIYTGMYRFKKSKTARDFFKLLEIVMKNWKVFYSTYAPNKMQNWNSVDLSAAIVLKILDSTYSNNMLKFTHMKPHLQQWIDVPSKWTDVLPVNFGNNNLYVGSYKQSGVFHYVEDNFLTSSMVAWLEEKV
jgi:hypothetical protein